MSTSNDTFYPLQWDFFESQGGMRVPAAWSVSKGKGVVVAVVDTGITSHSDLNANVLPGYDMISSSGAARDGDGRDADPRDEGDWTGADQCFYGDGGGQSSWHGTHVAGTVAAVTDNNQGVAGVAPEAKILPMRALGACGGYSSDIADAIIWAAGGSVSGTPSNANPARVINLSLGGSGACSSTYQSAIDLATSRGAAIVVAAGNENRPASESSPANCQNVITVGASTRNALRAPYSNYGPAVDVVAPGGDMSWNAANGIASTLNDGATSLGEEAYFYSQGTSMAAPHVAGVAAMLVSKLGDIATPAYIEERLKTTARPVPTLCGDICESRYIVDAAAAVGLEDGSPIPTPAPDTAGPVMVSSSVSPLSDNLDDGPAEITVTLALTDQTGVEAPFVLLGNDATGQSQGFGSMSLVSGSPKDGTWQRTMTIPQGSATGAWNVTLYPLKDTLGNGSSGFQSLGTGSITGAPSDTAGPVMVSSSVSPLSHNLDDGPAEITVTLALTDQTGVEAPFVLLGNDATGQSQGFGSMSLVSGSPKDGTWQRTMTIPQGSATGAWNVTLYPLKDTLGNGSSGFQSLGTVSITGAPSDTAGPVMVSSSVSPLSHNLDDGPAEITVTLALTDQTGVEAPFVLLGNDATGQSQGFGSMSLVSGSPKDGTWQRTMTIPQGSATGAWNVTLYPLKDTLGNGSTGFQSLGNVNITSTTTVEPTAVVFSDKDGTAEDAYTVPATDGVEYLVGNKMVPAGTYPGTGEVTVAARAKADYVLKSGAVASWTFTFKATPFQVSPKAVVFTDNYGTTTDTYTIPATEGVEYLLGDTVVAAGAYKGSGTVTVTAKTKPNYVLTDGAAASWTFAFKTTPHEVTPAAVVFTDKDGTAQDTYAVPATEGVDYFVGGKVVAAGTYAAGGTITVTAKATPDYVLKANTASSWSTTFKATFRFTSVVGTGDLNGDRKPDVLVLDSGGALWLYPGNARGGWLARVKVGSGWNGFTAVVGPGDMNGDGKADVLARDSGGTLWLYPGNGRGGWLARVKVGSGWNGFTAVVGPGDMNGDRKADILARDGNGALWLYRGNGRGGFLPRISAGVGWNGMTSIVAARDFNGDGRNDVLAVDTGGALWLYRGNGAGGWLGRVLVGSGWN
ncbi:S8 family serine peptidase [Arthrobacter sp. KBS0703]|uniref:S8 family serine peptidase n=1 Tax=Arthrobacter sp. KBS0703 TaxID=1955698 RepID=UPI00163DCD0F|nr:S8 family serine peptidase [Arthrobacter sp. KBS0703]